MNRSERDQSILDLVGGPGDEAVRAALLDLASLAEAPAPAPTDALAAVFDARPGPQRTPRSPGRIAGGTAAFVGLLVASGTAAAALGGGIPWIDDEPAAPRAVAARPSEPVQPVASGPYADAAPHARTSPRATGQTRGMVPEATEPESVRTTGSPTDLPRAGFRQSGRDRTVLTPRGSGADRSASDEGTPVADPHEPETAETPDRDTEAVTSLPSDPAAVTDRARQAKPAKETTTQGTVDRGLGQGKPVKVAKPMVAKPASATKLASWVKPTTGQGTQPTDPSSVTTDPATTPQDPGPAADAEPTAQP